VPSALIQSLNPLIGDFINTIGQIRSSGRVASMSGLPESGHGWAIYEYRPPPQAGVPSGMLSFVKNENPARALRRLNGRGLGSLTGAVG
jgi:hypothetical protein